jgi:hypothetical protein
MKYRMFLFLPLILLSTACSTGVTVQESSGKSMSGNSRDVVILTSNMWDRELRDALNAKKFHVKNQQAPFGVVLDTVRLDTCLINDNEKISVVVQVADQSKKEVIATIKAEGWTGECGHIRFKSVFAEVADQLNTYWSKAQ